MLKLEKAGQFVQFLISLRLNSLPGEWLNWPFLIEGHYLIIILQRSPEVISELFERLID